jgi:hypothetical protein
MIRISAIANEKRALFRSKSYWIINTSKSPLDYLVFSTLSAISALHVHDYDGTIQ